MSEFTIGRLAARAGVGVETVRYYERCGLLPEPPRSPAGYRLYDEEDVKRLSFIRTAKDLGFKLEEIGELLELRVDTGESCQEVERRAAEVLERVARQIAELEGIRRALQELVTACRRAELTDRCPILASIEEE